MNLHDSHCNHGCTLKANHSYTTKCNDSYMDSLAKRIEAIRIKAGDTPNSAAKKLGISRQAYGGLFFTRKVTIVAFRCFVCNHSCVTSREPPMIKLLITLNCAAAAAFISLFFI